MVLLNTPSRAPPPSALPPPQIGRLPAPSSPHVHADPARRRLAASPPPHHPWKAASAWAQHELLQQPAGRLAHHAAQMPRVSQPLRVEPPAEYNAPARVQSLHAGKRSPEMALSSKLARRPLTGVPTAKAHPEKMRDYAVLASACRRAGKPTVASHLVFNRGVLFENMGETGAALKCYKDLLRASLEAGDAVGEALACNAIGVLRMSGAADEKSLNEAISYHQQHLAVADIPGKFIAHCNLGLAYQALEKWEEATASHQHALRYAIRMSSLAGESLACGHLGMVSKLADVATAKACTERQLRLASTLLDERGREDAYLQLGGLAHLEGSWEEAQQYYEQALRVAQNSKDNGGSDIARCNVGLVQGNVEFEQFLRSHTG
ncbi:hypothetical protein AB1Y20_017012 [Prymnesium parvum]|uniref:MalT-like TPR region domain-containing protein n=1 Tax=Prymnesium parvum TaxID=97485 RepID=A0AB34IBG9_PRYPA